MATIYYIVRPGDTLADIAQRYDVTVEDIVRDNRIANPDQIYVGQRLRIISPPIPDTYTVQPGDSLYTIARRFNTTVPRLVRLNRLRNPNRIYPGQVLRLR